MVKTRVHDLAAEFGVAPEQLLSMLKDMNIFVRSHLSALESDQVSAVRVRWEREKRKSAEEPTAKKGRRKAVKAEPAAGAGRGQADQAPAHRRRGGEVEAQAQAEKAAEMAALELERPIVEPEEPAPTQSLEERATRAVQGPAARRRSRPRTRPPRPPRTPRRAPSRPPPRPSRCRRAWAPTAPPARRRRRRSSRRASSARRRRRRAAPSRSSAAAPRPRPSRPGAPSRPGGGPERSSRAAGPAVRPRRREGRRPEEGQEGQALVGGSGRGAGEHPEDPAGHEGPGRPEGRAPLRRAVAIATSWPAASPRRASARRPASGSTSSSRCPSSRAP